MGLSLRDGASVFQLECDRSRARYGVIWLAFRFDPPVAADVLGEFDGIGSAMLVSARVPHTYLDRLSQGRLLCNKKIVSAEKGGVEVNSSKDSCPKPYTVDDRR